MPLRRDLVLLLSEWISDKLPGAKLFNIPRDYVKVLTMDLGAACILMEKGKIDYDYFYDGEEETRVRLIEGIGITCEQADRHCAETLMDNAAYELEEQDVVEIEELDSMLADGNPNYRTSSQEINYVAAIST